MYMMKKTNEGVPVNEKIAGIIECGQIIRKAVASKHHEIAQQHNLSLEQFHLLIELDELELDVSEEVLPPTVGQIAANLGNAPHTLSEKIKRLEKKGLVEKIKDAADLRINRVILTEKGRSLMDQIKQEAGTTFVHQLLEQLDEDALISLSEGLNRVVKLLNDKE